MNEYRQTRSIFTGPARVFDSEEDMISGLRTESSPVM